MVEGFKLSICVLWTGVFLGLRISCPFFGIWVTGGPGHRVSRSGWAPCTLALWLLLVCSVCFAFFHSGSGLVMTAWRWIHKCCYLVTVRAVDGAPLL